MLPSSTVHRLELCREITSLFFSFSALLHHPQWQRASSLLPPNARPAPSRAHPWKHLALQCHRCTATQFGDALSHVQFFTRPAQPTAPGCTASSRLALPTALVAQAFLCSQQWPRSSTVQQLRSPTKPQLRLPTEQRLGMPIIHNLTHGWSGNSARLQNGDLARRPHNDLAHWRGCDSARLWSGWHGEPNPSPEWRLGSLTEQLPRPLRNLDFARLPCRNPAHRQSSRLRSSDPARRQRSNFSQRQRCQPRPSLEWRLGVSIVQKISLTEEFRLRSPTEQCLGLPTVQQLRSPTELQLPLSTNQ